MRLLTLVGVLLAVGGVYLLVDAGLIINRCVRTNTLSFTFWATDFWLRAPDSPTSGLGPNAQWLLRAIGGLIGVSLGSTIIKVTK